MSNYAQIAVGRLVNRRLHIHWREREFDEMDKARVFANSLPVGWECDIIQTYEYVDRWRRDERGRLYRYTEKCPAHIVVRYRPTELREIYNLDINNEIPEYRPTLRTRDGRLRPIIEDWNAVRDKSIAFINETYPVRVKYNNQ